MSKKFKTFFIVNSFVINSILLVIRSYILFLLKNNIFRRKLVCIPEWGIILGVSNENYIAELNKLIVDNLTDVIYIVGFDERFLFISSSVKDILGFTPEEVIGKKIQNFLTPQSYEKQKLAMEKVIAEKRFDASEKLILSVLRKDGSKLWIEAHAKFLRGPKGELNGILGVARDVTDRVKTVESLMKKIEDMEI